MSDSFGRRPMALIGLLVLTISVLAAPFAPNFETLLALRVLTGLGGGMIPPNAVGVIADVISPERRAQALSALLAIGMSSAISVAFVALLADWGGWRFAFLVSGLLIAAGFLANLIWFPRDRGERVRDLVIFPRYRSLIRTHFFQVALSVNITQRLAFWGILAFFAAYLIHTYDVSLGFVAVPLVINAIGQMIGTYSAAFVATTRYRALFIAVTSVAGGVCGFLFFAVELELWVAVAVGNDRNGIAKPYISGFGLRQHRVFGGIEGHWRQSNGPEQSVRRRTGGGGRRRVVSGRGLRGDRLPVSRRNDFERAGGGPVWQAVALGDG